MSHVQRSCGLAFAGAVIGIALFVVAMIVVVGKSFSVICTDPAAAEQHYSGCLTAYEMFGIFLAMISGVLTIYCLGALVYIAGLVRSKILTVAVTWTTLAFAIWIMVVLCKPQATFDTGPNPSQSDPLQQLLGGMLFVALIPLLVVSIFVDILLPDKKKQKHWLAQHDMDGTLSVRTPLLVNAERRPAEHADIFLPREQLESDSPDNLLAVTLLAAFFGIIFMMCISLSPVWNYTAHSYFPFPSPDSLVHWVINANFNFKVYTDVVVYFSFIGCLIVFGTISHLDVQVRRRVSERVRVVPATWTTYSTSSPLGQLLVPFPHGASIGELFVCSSVAGLYLFWVYYWRWGYPRIVTEAKNLDAHPDMQIAARVVGHLANLSISFLLFPVAHNSLWERVFGIPFERALKYHRVLGGLTWFFVTLHALLWWVKWILDGTLGDNIVTIVDLKITPDWVHFDNFTVPIVELAWALMTLSIILAIFCRRKHYELFYASHQICAVFFFMAALIHAWTLWYYAIAGLILWVFDRALRLQHATVNCVSLHSVRYDNGVTELELPRGAVSYFFPGQYVFLQVPCISLFEWHPFTISSSPSASTIKLCIKNMGDNTFSDKVARWSGFATRPETAPKEWSYVSLDGPYGRTTYYGDHPQVLLVAGGIGITPMHSIFADLLDRAASGLSISAIRHVSLCWVARDEHLFSLFSPTLQQASSAVPGLAAEYVLFCTRSRDLSPNERFDHLPLINYGRPDIGNWFADASRKFAGRNTIVLVCGPEQLVSEVSEQAFVFGFDFHAETFLF